MNEGMDELDQRWMESALPEGAIAQGFVAIVAWLDPESGDERWKYINLLDGTVSKHLGLLEMAKHSLLSSGAAD